MKAPSEGNPNTTMVTDLNLKSGKTTSNTYCGTPSGDPQGPAGANGVIFVNGDVKGVSGTVHGDYTIAVPDNIRSRRNAVPPGPKHPNPRTKPLGRR